MTHPRRVAPPDYQMKSIDQFYYCTFRVFD